MKTNPILALLAAVGMFLGCASTPTTPTDQTRRIESVARVAAFATVSSEIRSDPEARDDFDSVLSGLAALSNAEHWDLNTATEIFLASGVRELQGPDGMVILQTGLLILVATDVNFDAAKTEHAAALICGLESGIRLALAVRQ